MCLIGRRRMAAITATTRRTKTPPSPKAFEHVSFCGVVCGSFVWASMASFDETPPRNSKNGEKIFKTKCAQCHTIDKGADNKQADGANSAPWDSSRHCL
ncbi:hypothetical protein AAZX31_14G160900 [Glycine max]|nr:uncharacterized protein LOC114384587 isoform X2 [Glycine soja]